MSNAASRSDRDADASARLAGIRATSGVSLGFAATADGVTRLAHLEESGGFRAKFPQPEHGVEAVTINTGGGMLGGDTYGFKIDVGPGATALIASQSAERIYRTLGPAATVDVSLRAAPGATLYWTPQETILFSGAKLSRRLDADIATDATLLIVEAFVFGRAAMGEDINIGALSDHWRIRRCGTLVFADAVRISGDIHSALQSRAIGAGARASATVLYLAPDAEERRDAARDALGEPAGRAALSAWNGMLVGRFLAPDSATLRADIICLTEHLMRRPMSRVWGV